MSKPTIHFVYSVPMSGNIFRRAIDKFINISGFLPPLYRTGTDLFIPWRQPIRAPHSISYNLLHTFKKHANVKYYSLYERRTIRLKDDDILLGVPAQKPGDMPWKKPDENTIMVRTLKRYPNHKSSYIILPYSNEAYFVRWADELVSNYGKNLLLIGGQIWMDQWKDSPWSKYAINKKTRVEMGIDPKDYPPIKKTFSKKGERGFFYVGHTSWYKNIEQLEKIAKNMPGYKFGHVGLGKIKGWNKIADFADINEEFMKNLAKDYDCFVNVSSDAQVTTVLEQMCFGMFVACTPESGYSKPTLMELDFNDTDFNISQLKKFQEMDESELIKITKRNRDDASKNNTWEQFCSTVTNFIGLTENK